MRRKNLQTSFSSGELAPDLILRQDTDQYQSGAKSLLNRRCLIGGGTRRRPGSWHQADLVGTGRAEDFVVDQTTQYVLVFTAGRVDAYLRDTSTGELTASGSLTSAPWTGTIYAEMDYVQSGNTAFLMHQDMATQVLERTGAATWARSAYSFFASGPRIEQPYYKVAPAAMTLTPSALTGSITLTVSGSSAWFVSAHVGAKIRYLERECTITAVAGNGLSCTATVDETLPATNRLTVGSSAGFTVNESVEGGTTGAKGIITGISDSTHLDIVSTNQTAFAGTEKVVGPQASSAMSATTGATPAAITDWDEQLIGAVHGYPACGVLHRNRMLFGGHPAVPNAVIGSRTNNLYSFDVDDGSDTDGFLETIGDAGASNIVRMHSSEQLLIATDKGLYYVPESAAYAFRPSSIAFFPFGQPWPITATRPRAFDDGVLFLSGSVIIKARPTGDTTRMWMADEVSLLANHLLTTPGGMAVTSNFAGGPERYAVAVNSDGTLAILQLIEAQKIRNMVPWTTSGEYTSACAIQGDLYVTTERTINGSTKYYLEMFDQDVTLDMATEYATTGAMASGVASRYGSTTVNVVVGSYHLGAYPFSLITTPAGPYVAGLYYDSEIETFPPSVQDGEGEHAGEMMRICRFSVRVQDSARFSGNGTTLAAYQVTDSVDAAPPDKNGWYHFLPLAGWSEEPSIIINQPDPLPLDVLGIKATVVVGK